MEWQGRNIEDRGELTLILLVLIYGHEHERARPALAAKLLQDRPDLVEGDDFLACATGDRDVIWRAVITDPEWVDRNEDKWRCPECKGLLSRPPLIAVTHSSLGRLPEYRDRLMECVKLLLEAGADPDQAWSESKEGHPLSALYGAAGFNHNPEMTKLLLAAGANPNDGESLYHSLEGPDLACTRLLLEAGAKVEGSNALHYQLDSDNLDGLRLLLSTGANPNDSSSSLGPPLLWAIRRRRSAAHVEALLKAGADPLPGAYRLAKLNGLVEVAEVLRQAGAEDNLSIEDQFVAACARSDEAEARRILAERPTIIGELSEQQLRQLPQLIESRNEAAARLMVELGWPIAVTGGDWGASALNHAVYQGNAPLARFLLEHGASWEERHGHGDSVRGTLAWSSRNSQFPGDWVGCAEALVAHGMPIPKAGDFDGSEEVLKFFSSAAKPSHTKPPHH